MKSRLSILLYLFVSLYCFNFLAFAETPPTGSSEVYKDHGWAILDVVANKTPYSMIFYSEPRGLETMLPKGCITRIRALKTGFGNLYRVAKKADKVWRLYADTRDAKDAATQFTVDKVGKYIILRSEIAEGFLIASEPKTFDVFLKNDKVTDNSMWELVEDPKAGDTLETLYLKNKATGGLLTASYDASGGDEAKISGLEQRIQKYEDEIPYLKITYARTGGAFNNPSLAGSCNIKDKLNERIKKGGHVLSVTGKDWMTQLSGKNATQAGWPAGRKVVIRYIEGNSNEEKQFTGKEGSPLEIRADISNHPATPLIEELKALQSKSTKIKGLASSDVGRTGIDNAPFEMSQWSKVALELVVDIPTDDDYGAPKDTIAGGSSFSPSIWAHRKPEIKGSGNYKLDGFGPEMVVTVNPLYSRGFVWLEESLPIPGQGTVVFRALSAGGDVHVCFSNDVTPQTVYRIAFGAAENTKTIIYKNEEIAQEITNEQNPNARIIPGMIEQMWVSIKNGFIMVGKGDPGTNIIMAWQDPKPSANIERVGFSTFKSVVKFADVQKIADPIVIVAPQVAYVKDEKQINIGTDTPEWHSLPLSPPDAGTIVFEVNGTEGVSLFLSNQKSEGYKISFGAEENTAAKILRLSDDKELYNIDSGMLPLAALKSDSSSKFWVSLYKGLIVIGSGDAGQNTFCVFVDSKSPKGISKIGFSGKASIKNLEIWPEVELGFEQDVSEYTKKRNFSAFKCAMRIISPYQYRIFQEGPQVRFRDKLTGMQWNMAGTPEPDGKYHFKIDVLETGEPQIQLTFQDPSAEKVKLEASVKMNEAMAESTFRLSQNLAYATGPEIVSSLIAIAASASIGSAAVGIRAAQMKESAKLDELQGLSNRYIYTERAEKQAGGTVEIRTEAQRNRQILESKLESILQLQLQDAVQLDYATKQWADALRLVTDFYVVEDKAVERKLTEGLQTIYKTVNSLDLTNSTLPLFQTIINTLIDAYNNPYLTSVGDIEEVTRRKDWYVWINDLATRLMSNSSLMGIGINIKFRGEYLWFPQRLPSSGSGSITFEAKGYNNIFVGIAENPYKVRNVNNRMYEIIFGMWDNKVTAIHRKSLGDSVVEFDHKTYPQLSPDPATFKKYWINIDKGIISMGVGELGRNKLVEWKDPYPMAPVTCVGFSNWLSEVTIKNVRVGYPISTTSAIKSGVSAAKKVAPKTAVPLTPASQAKTPAKGSEVTTQAKPQVKLTATTSQTPKTK